MLSAVAAGLAGCNYDSRRRPTTSPTAVPTPTESPYPESVAGRLGSSRFDEASTCYANVPCFHQLDASSRPDAVQVPERERVTAASPSATIRTHNLGDEPLVVAEDVLVGKRKGIGWQPTVPFHETTGTLTVDPGESLARAFDIEGRGDGRYAVVERAGWGGPRGTVGMTVESQFTDDRFRFGAMIEVVGSTWTPSPAGLPVERNGDTLHILPEANTDRRLHLEKPEQDVGIPLVPETIDAHPPTNDAIFGLRRDGVTRTTTPMPELSLRYLQVGLIYSQPVTPDMTLRLDDILFNARLE